MEKQLLSHNEHHIKNHESLSNIPYVFSGCIAACNKCWRSCSLNFPHNGPHECSEGHHWL